MCGNWAIGLSCMQNACIMHEFLGAKMCYARRMDDSMVVLGDSMVILGDSMVVWGDS